MILYDVRNIKNKNGVDELHAVVSEDCISKDGIIEKILEVEKLTYKLIDDLNVVLKKLEKQKKNNIKLHWQLGDIIVKHMEDTKKLGFTPSCIDRMLSQFMLKYKNTYWKRRKNFRLAYPKTEILNEDFSFEVYYELAMVKDKKRRDKIEKMLLDKKINSRDEIRKMRNRGEGYHRTGRKNMEEKNKRIKGIVKPEQYKWIKKQIQEGKYNSISEIIRKGIDELKQQEE